MSDRCRYLFNASFLHRRSGTPRERAETGGGGGQLDLVNKVSLHGLG